LKIAPDGEGVLRYHDGAPLPPAEAEPEPKPFAEPLPDWAFARPKRGYRERPWLRPSDLISDKQQAPGLGPLDANEVRRYRRGTLIHKLLQLLPDIPAERQASVAETFLRRHNTEDSEVGQIRDEVMNLLRSEKFAPYFAQGSLAEVPIVSLLGDPETHVSGRIDRLAVTAHAIHLVDFKTDRHPPSAVAGVDPAYIGQLATYARALRAIYPGKTVNAGLLWTAEARLMVIPAEHLT
jgi:ATP-dependent helicase/nuclease subunit A